MVRATHAQTIRKMRPGILGGQTWSPTRVAPSGRTHLPQRIVPPSHCLHFAFSAPTGAVPGHPTMTYITGIGSRYDSAGDVLTGAFDTSDSHIYLASFTPPGIAIGLHPGPIKLTRVFAFCVGPDDSVYNLYEDPSFTPADSVHLEKWTPSGTLVYSAITTSEVLPATGLVYNPTNDTLYGNCSLSNVGIVNHWDPATGAMTSLTYPGGGAPYDNAAPVVTSDGFVWWLDLDQQHVARLNPTSDTFDHFPLGFTAIAGIWLNHDGSKVVVLKNDLATWCEIDGAGVITVICTEGPPSDLSADTLVSSDWSNIYLGGVSNNYYGWS